MKISASTKMPRISDKDLMYWYELGKTEVKEFKSETGYKFMKDQMLLADNDQLKDYMQLVFSQKKHLELFLAETNDVDLAFELFIAPFIFQATRIIKRMPEMYHEYASWYTNRQLRLDVWLRRKTMDEMLYRTGAFQEEN